jgi:hypothetical protein
MSPRWTALPAARSKAPVLQIRLFLVLGVLILAASFGLISLVAWINVKPTPPTPTPVSASASATVATNYLLGQSTVVPVAPVAATTAGVQWTLDQTLGLSPNSPTGTRDLYSLVLDKSGSHPYGFTITTYGPTGATVDVETDYYVAVTNYGTFVVAVPMYLTATGSQLAALPSLSAYAPVASGTNTGLDYHLLTGYEAPSSAMNAAVQSWAQAYVTGTPTLASIVLAPNIASPDYESLTGFTLTSATALGAVPGAGVDAGYVYVRVRLVIASTSANGVSLTMDTDLMLQQTTAQPAYKAVAWGPTGSAGSLVPYQTNLYTNQ